MVTKVKGLTLEQLKTLVDELVEDKLEEMFGDPDKGLDIKEEVLKELRASRAAARRGKRGIPLEQLAKELGINLE